VLGLYVRCGLGVRLIVPADFLLQALSPRGTTEGPEKGGRGGDEASGRSRGR